MEAAVLRVKRKRGADPAEALIISCKRLREEEAEQGAGGGDSGSSSGVSSQVFRLATTVTSQNEPIQKYVHEAISRDRASQVLHPSLGNLHRIQKNLRSQRHAERQDSRYRLVSGLRPKCDDEPDSASGKSPDGSLVIGQQEKDEASAPEESGLQVFDMVQEETEKEEDDLKAPDPETIMCNSVMMIRERLTVSEAGQGASHREKAEEFVYDIYYAESSPHTWIQDILSVQPYSCDQELVPEELEQDDIYEDEDDENEESNWRNDYPDEDDSDKEERYMGYYEDDDDEEGHRGHAWDAYYRKQVSELDEEY